MNKRHSKPERQAMPRRKRRLAAFAIGLALGGGTAMAAEIRLNNLDVESGGGLDDPAPASPIGGNPGRTRGEQARIVFEYAASLWGAVLKSEVPIAIDASFSTDAHECQPEGGSLGHAMPMKMWRFQPGAQPAGARADTLYHVALANALAGKDVDPGGADVLMRFNGAIGSSGCMEALQWYFGLDGNTPANQANFLNVVMHELAHGLGFSAFNDLAKGEASMEDGVAVHDIYSIHVYDNVLRKYWHQMSSGERVSAAVNDGHLVFAGPHLKAHARLRLAEYKRTHTAGAPGMAGQAHAGLDPTGNVLLYAPRTLASSSFTHFDPRVSPDPLMQPFELAGLKAHLDLDLTPSLLQDLGWQLHAAGQKLGSCDTGVPSWTPGGAITGANIVATAKLLARTSASVDDYAAAIRAHAASLEKEGRLTAQQASSLRPCLSPTETARQYARWHRNVDAKPLVQAGEHDLPDHPDAADSED